MVILVFAMFLVSGCGNEGTVEDAVGSVEEVVDGVDEVDSVEMPERIIIGASEPGSAWYIYGSAFKEILENEFPGTIVDIFYGGGDINLTALQEGEVDFGITFGASAYDASQGRGNFSEPHDNVRGVVGIYETTLVMAVRENSDIYSVADLEGKTISSGLPGYATTGILQQILPVCGLDLDTVSWEYATMPDVALMFKDGAVDMAAIYAPVKAPFPAIEEIAVSTDIRLLPFPKECFDQALEINPGLVESPVPAGLYKGQEEEVYTHGVIGALYSRAGLSDEIVFAVVKALIDNRDKLEGMSPDLGYISVEDGHVGLGLELHNGAVEFYQAMGTLN